MPTIVTKFAHGEPQINGVREFRENRQNLFPVSADLLGLLERSSRGDVEKRSLVQCGFRRNWAEYPSEQESEERTAFPPADFRSPLDWHATVLNASHSFESCIYRWLTPCCE